MADSNGERQNRQFRALVKKVGRSAIFGGVVGGMAFAVVSPFVLPVVTPYVAEAGTYVGQPDIEVETIGGPMKSVTRDDLTYPAVNSTYNYTIFVRNTNPRIAEEVRLSFFFKGCPIERGFYAQNGDVFANPDVEFDQANCIATVYIPKLAQGEEILLKFNIRAVPPSKANIPLLVIGPDHDMAYRSEYLWRINGMSFAEDKTVQMNSSV